MGILKKSALGLAASALVMTSAAPAMARDYGYDGYGRHNRHHDRIDGGDVLTGIGILAGIAILASAASSGSKSRNRTSERYPDQYPQSRDNSAYRSGSDDVGAAVSACSQAAERSAGDGTRVDEIRSVTRDGSAWLVEGALGGGRNSGSFRCSATYGQVDYIRLG
jgi:hypothetical protein